MSNAEVSKEFKCTIFGEESFPVCPFDTGERAICFYMEALSSEGKTKTDCDHWKEVDGPAQ